MICIVMNNLSMILTNYFVSKKLIPYEKMEIYNYGFKLMLSDIINFSIIMLLGVLLNRVLDGLVYLVVLCSIRRFSGGFHAKTFWLCRLSMIITFLLILTLVDFLSFITISPLTSVFINIVLLLFIAVFSPVKHPNKKLNSKQIKKNKYNAILVTILWTPLSVFLIYLNITQGITIVTTILAVVILMALGMINKEGGRSNV